MDTAKAYLEGVKLKKRGTELEYHPMFQQG
jgi:hypothetical protein